MPGEHSGGHPAGPGETVHTPGHGAGWSTVNPSGPGGDNGSGYDDRGFPIYGAKYTRERIAYERQVPGYAGSNHPVPGGWPDGTTGKQKPKTPVSTHPAPTHSSGGGGGGGAAAPHASGGGGGNNVARIVSFFRGKGLSDPQIAGILGNMQTESSFNPSAYNAGEGAIGLAQWEGGRRSALQSYAARNGGHESDLNMQLGFMWSEMTGPESGALAALRNTHDAASAAAVWDTQYERSSGSSHGQRISNATSIFSSGMAASSPTSGGGGGSFGSGGGASGGGSGGGGGGATSADFSQAMGDLSGLLTSVPELKNILSQAVSGGWAVSKFQQAVDNSHWYRSHNDAAKRLVSLQSQDPAQYRTEVQNATQQARNIANQLGVSLSSGTMSTLVQRYLIEGWDTQTLQNAIGARWNSLGADKGQAAAFTGQLQQLYSSMGIPTNDATLDFRTRQLLAGNTTIDTYKQAAQETAKSMYPSLAKQIDGGMTVKDIADPYMQQMGNLLEIDPNTLDVNNPLIKKALQGSVVTTGTGKTATHVATSTPLWQFENTLRADPRWAKTQNATDTMSTSLVKIGQDFGFAT